MSTVRKTGKDLLDYCLILVFLLVVGEVTMPGWTHAAGVWVKHIGRLIDLPLAK